MSRKAEIEAVLKLFEKKSSDTAFLDAYAELFSKKKIECHHILCAILALFISVLIKYNNNSISVLINIVELFNGVTISLFGIVFTGYAIFQALIDGSMLRRLLKVKNNMTAIQTSNVYFLNVMFLNFGSIIINVVIMLIGNSFPICILSLFSNLIKSVVLILFSLFYIFFQLLIILETKCFVFNIYQLFNVYAGTKAVDLLKEEKEDNINPSN